MTATLSVPEVDHPEVDDTVDTIELDSSFREEPTAPPDDDGPPLLTLPESRLTADAEAEERHVDCVLRTLYAVGGTATYRELHDRVPAAMNRRPDDTPGSTDPTPLDLALRHVAMCGTVAVAPDGFETTYHLTNAGAILIGMPTLEQRDLRDLLSELDSARAGIANLISGEADGWAREHYAGLSYKLAAILRLAGLASTRAGVTENPHAFAGRTSVAFHDLTRGRHAAM